ncbi:sensor domain-containing protein [Mycobacterium ahvazicum]|uniref:Sensor domain-containing protein n=1 Tax=Mycobacterium ahvazicum TaxID=1964395 RepID=A0A2K4YE72_9MYCO|nr:sensor domain-containing protein [Mycobacterium ahvazicum]SOX55058.1 sensor domain-containing protein [Mycobacterium ahvazicum]
MSYRWCSVAPLIAVLLATGCTSTIGGKAVPAPAPPLLRLLLDGATLSKLLDQPFQRAPYLPPSYGGSEKLGTAWEDSRPAECIGVRFMMQKMAYASVPVKGVADEIWANDGHSVRVDDVDEGVVSFPSAKDAAAAFATLSAQWQGCDGATLTTSDRTFPTAAISDVRVADSVVAASILMNPHAQSILAGIPIARALGVRGNYVFEVAVRFYGVDNPGAQGTADPKTSAVDIAHAMMDRLALS